ncbi:uncharacterized protein LOC112684704 [Sipha flava]|uniref:Uncharacterized protein LOC112684704 n=1 Tax=Sipha flava TaxID=143950 RepID=A0A2S2QE33_9HEMI|nr:uncharacterized protein LOC112684704 [Sipha flava]
MVPFGRVAMSFAALVVCGVNGSADRFQCACGYNALDHVRTVRATLADGKVNAAVVVAAEYGPLASRMLAAAHSRPEPTARWLWLLNMYANTVRWHAIERRHGSPGSPLDRVDGPALLADAAAAVEAEVARYVRACAAHGLTAGAKWSRDRLQNHVLELLTSAMERPRDDGRTATREVDFAPEHLYLNDVTVDAVLAADVGVDWRTTASWMAHVYQLARRKWVLGTRELVLYQKRFLSTAAASMMGHVLVHVTHCQRHWLKSASDSSYVDEYERTWMSVGNLLAKFAEYLDLGPEEYYRAMLDVAANPVRDHDGFVRVKHVIRTYIAEVGGGLFGALNDTAIVAAAESAETAAARADAATSADSGGQSQSEQHTSLIDLIALIDTNIGAAEKYIASVRALLPGVNFRVVKDFMRSTHIWLT